MWLTIGVCLGGRFFCQANGKRREGIYTGFLTFLQKLASSLAILLTGWFLGFSGYKAGIAQFDRTLWSIRILLGPIPAVFLFASIVLAYFYPITREYFKKIREELDSRKSVSASVLEKHFKE